MKASILTIPLLVLFSSSGIGQSDAPRTVGKVLLIDGEKSVEMKYSMSNARATMSIFSTAKQYLILPGTVATLRIKNPLPVFEFYADAGLNVETAVYVLRFDRESDRRQVRVAKAKGRKAASGVPKDHTIAGALEEIGDGPNSTKHYRLKPSSPLRPGEYCLVRSNESCFDFGVDP
jgi:hypothetical protein